MFLLLAVLLLVSRIDLLQGKIARHPSAPVASPNDGSEPSFITIDSRDRLDHTGDVDSGCVPE